MSFGNRRRKRNEYLLDVKVQTQGRLRQRVKVGLSLVAVVAVFTLTGYGLYRLVKLGTDILVFENPRFAVAQIVVETDGVLTPVQVAQLAGVHVGQNLLSLDLDWARRNLESVPVVARVEVRRQLPNRLYLRVDERIAVARLQGTGRESGDAALLVDRTGMVMQPLRLGDGTVMQPQRPGPIPVLTGVPLANVRVGKRVESEPVYRALDLLDKLQQSAANALLEVERVDLSKPHQLVLTTRQQAVVRFDREEFPQQVRRLGVILSWAQQRRRTVQSVDLAVSRGVPVTFVN